VEPETQDSTRLANQIAQLLPLPEAEKFKLLAELDPLRLLDRLLLILDAIAGE
jgi:Lon protease-like protein